MNEDSRNIKYSKIKGELLLLQSRSQKDEAKKSKDNQINQNKCRIDGDVTSIIQTLPVDRTLIQKQKLINFFRYTTLFQKILKKNPIDKVSTVLEKCAERVQFRYINQGDILYKYMEKSDSLYFIISGEASVLIPKKYEQMEDEKSNKIQLSKNSVISNTYMQSHLTQQRQIPLQTIQSIVSNQTSNLKINLNAVNNTALNHSHNHQSSDFRINSLVDIPLDISVQKEGRRVGITSSSSIQLSPIRSTRMKRTALIATQQIQQQYFFQELIDCSPTKSIDHIRKLNSMSLIQEMELNKSRSFHYSPRKQHQTFQNSSEKNYFSQAAAKALLNPEKVKQNYPINNQNNIEIYDSLSNSHEKQTKINFENSPNSISSEEIIKGNYTSNGSNMGVKLIQNESIQTYDNRQSYLNNSDQVSEQLNQMISSFSQIPFDENDTISERSEGDSVIADSKPSTPLNLIKFEEKKISNLEKIIMSEPEFQLCFGSLYPHEINNCALYFFDGNTFKYNFGQRLHENQNTDTIDIIQKQPRSTTCVALKPLQLAQLDKNDYNDMLKDLEEVNLWRKVDQICKSFDVEKIPNLKKMIAEFFPFLQKVIYKRGQFIFQEGDLTKGCYIIKSGEIELTKYSIIEPPQEFQDENQFRNWQSYCNPQEISLSLISDDQFFGEEDMLRNRKYRQLNARCKQINSIQQYHCQKYLFQIQRSSECKLYFISKIHFLRILYESNIVVDVFEKRAKLKDKWHKDKYDKMIKILNEDYDKQLGRNLFEEKKKEILGKKGPEDVENEKQLYKSMTGMFRDTYEKMLWKMSVADELAFPYKQKNKEQVVADNEIRIKDEKISEIQKQNKKRIQLKLRSNSTDTGFYDDLNSQKQKVMQYGRLKIYKGSKQTFLEEKMTILADLQDRQMRQIENKKTNQIQKTVEDIIKIGKKSEKVQNNDFKNKNTALNTNYSSKQTEQEQIQNEAEFYYLNTFSKTYQDWKKRSQSLDKMKFNEQCSNQIKNNDSSHYLTEKKFYDQFQDYSPSFSDMRINTELTEHVKHPSIKNFDSLQKQTIKTENSQTSQFINLKSENVERQSAKKIQKYKDQYQKTKTLDNVIEDLCQNNKNQVNQKDIKSQLVNDQQKNQLDENQKQQMSMLTCKIMGYQENLQTTLNNIDKKNKESQQEGEDETILQRNPTDLKMKTARTSAEAITSHFMKVLSEQESTTLKKKGKKVKRNKLDIIEYRLKGQVWANMQMKRVLSKFELKQQMTERKEKSQERQSLSPTIQQGSRKTSNGQKQLLDCKYHNIFQKVKNQVIEIYDDKFNKNNVHVPAFTILPYKNNAEQFQITMQQPQQVDNTDLSKVNIDPQKQNNLQQKQQIVKTIEFKRLRPSQTKLSYATETKSQNKYDFQGDTNNIDDIIIKNNKQTENKLYVAQQDQNFEFRNSQPKPWITQKIIKSNSIQLLEAYVQRQKLSNPHNSPRNEESNNEINLNKKNNSESNLSSFRLQSRINSECNQNIKEQFQKDLKQQQTFSSNQIMNSNKSLNNSIVNYHTPLKPKISRTNSQYSAQRPQTNQLIHRANQRKRIFSSQITSTDQSQSQIPQKDLSIENSKQYQVIVQKSQIILRNPSRERSSTLEQINSNRQQIQQRPIDQKMNKKTQNSQKQGKSVQNISSEKITTNNTSIAQIPANNTNITQISTNNTSITQNKNNERLIDKIDLKVKEILQDDSQQTIMNNQQRNNSQIIKCSTKMLKPSSQLKISNQNQTRIKQSDKSDSSIVKTLDSSQLSYFKTLNVQNKPNSLVVINHQGKPLSYQFK